MGVDAGGCGLLQQAKAVLACIVMEFLVQFRSSMDQSQMSMKSASQRGILRITLRMPLWVARVNSQQASGYLVLIAVSTVVVQQGT
jgi:hypothetical protein